MDSENTLNFNDEVNELIGIVFEDYDFIGDFLQHMKNGESSLTFNRKTLNKTIDESWVSTIEDCLPALDHVIRSPGRDIKEIEEVIPVELVRKVSPRSIKHLTQHTNLISDIDADGNIIPTKILNVYKEEDFLTYENKFVNTLVDRLYIFLHRRLKQLEENANDEFQSDMALDVSFENGNTEINVGLTLSAKDKKDFSGKGGNTELEGVAPLLERARSIMKIVDGYKASPFAQKMGQNFVRPPIMRTNAILKNQYYKQCLVLWQFIESYNSLGFSVNAKETVEKPPKEIMQNVYSLLAMQYMLFRQSTVEDPEGNLVKKTRKTSRPVAPQLVKSFSEELVEDYNYYEVENKKVLAVYPGKSKRKLSRDEMNVRVEIDKALASEKHYSTLLAKKQKSSEKKSAQSAH